MNVNEEDFQKRLNEIGNLYEDGKDCLATIVPLHTDSRERDKLYDILHELRNIAAVAVKQAYQLKEN